MANLYVSSVGWAAVLPWLTGNQFLWSEDLTNAVWAKTDSTITANATTDPLGGSTADLVTEGSAGSAAVIQSLTVVSGATWAHSRVFKRGNHDWVRLNVSDPTGNHGARAWFNINTGATGTLNTIGTGVAVSSSITSLGGGWYRCTLIGASVGFTTYALASISASSDGQTTRVSGATRYEYGALSNPGNVLATYATTTTVGVGIAYSVGDLRRQNTTPAVGAERVFRCTTAGTGGSEPSWNLSKGGTTADGTVVWTEVTGSETYQAPGAWAAPHARLLGAVTFYLNAINLISAGGAGYTVGDILTTNFGSAIVNAQLRVATVDGTGRITGTVIVNGGAYTAAVSNTVAATGGTGTGASFGVVTGGFLCNSAANDNIFVASNHAETQASALTLTFLGTDAAPNFIYCADETVAGHVPPTDADLRTTGSVSVTGANALIVNGGVYCYGLTFNGSSSGAGGMSVQTVSGIGRYEKCALNVGGTSGLLTVGVNAAVIRVDLIDCTLGFSVTNQSLRMSGLVNWKNSPAVGPAVTGAAPTTFLNSGSSMGGRMLWEGLDLSSFGSGKTLIGAPSGMQAQSIYIKDCKLGASVTVSATPTGFGRSEVFVIRSDSGAGSARNEKYSYAGTETAETTITRSAGASDGVTGHARKLVTTANSKWILPCEATPIQVYLDQVGVPYTITLEGTINAGAVPTNDEIWLEAEYLGDANSPQGSRVLGTKANNLAVGTNLAASTATWNGGGSGGGWSPFQLSATFTPQQAGWVTLYVKAAKPSTTYYVDPRPTGLNIVKTYVAGSPSPIIINERDLADTSLDAIDIGIAA